ncbi:spore cortex biosynthesis protein YabQ [Kroppenstedtia pulmonis]|uniref:Spore cortex biosynthesis protein YabQ n=1 Tax=Kroppenstedtia pulmonis TaxID=1380685 RepID=A0A7D4BDW5_9BACL|nr:spore cortex biosynthesis protein YabQ [Kroppenstedtia pulmonis]QKG83092.1 spore cortex biosynthesis protein YabQ [Kroppenstedtia pulmonis]
MTLYTQWVTMGLMLGSGWLMGLILDTYRVLCHRFRLRGWVVSLVDLLYWSVSAGLVVSLLMWSNWGELRFYVFVAVISGLAVYYYWFSRGMMSWIRRILDGLEKIIRWLLKLLQVILWTPVVTVGIALYRLLTFLLRTCIQVLMFPLRLLKPAAKIFHPVLSPIQTGWGRIRRLFSGKKRRDD